MHTCITGTKESEIAAGPAQLIPSANPGPGTLKERLPLPAISATKSQRKEHSILLSMFLRFSVIY
jgi:hypothetical protein